MKRKWTDDQWLYTLFMEREPSGTEDILTMNYCIAWCKAYGKNIQDWVDGGFNNHMYSPMKDKRKAKVLRHQMEMML